MSSAACIRRSFLLAGVIGLAACSDGPTDPSTARPPATLAISSGDAQVAVAGSAAAIAPAVRVTDAAGDPVPDVAVTFAVTSGGGSIAVASVRTDASGSASAGVWTLGPLPGENTLQATVSGLAPVHFVATAESPYTMTVRYVGPVTAAQRAAVEEAVSRWRTAIIRDLSDITLTAPAGSCFDAQPSINETIDDLLLFVQFTSIDGAGKVLGQAGPCYIRDGSDLPLMGVVWLDADDLVNVEAAGALDDLVLHEIGHVLGFGTMWPDFGLLTGSGTSNPTFTGATARAAFGELGGTGGVPVENTGSSGTRDGHWRESVFRHELMTGYLSSAENPLSALTVASLADIGYTTSTQAASAYVLGAAVSAAQASLAAAPTIDLAGAEEVIRPRYRVSRNGTQTRLAH